MAEVRERVYYEGKLCTIIEKKRGKLTLRDPFGFTVEGVRPKDTDKIKEDEPERQFTFGDPV